MSLFFRLFHSNETVFSASSIDWLTGLMALMTNVLIGGIRIISDKPYNAEYFHEIIVKYKVTVLFTNPPAMMELSQLPTYTKENMSSLRTVIMGGTPCSEKILKRVRSCLTNAYVYFGYGNTEVGPISWNWQDYKLKSVGKILPNSQLIIVDQNTGKRLGPNEMGEICVKKHNVAWQGYYNNPESTSKTVDSDGFTHTADMGYVDEDHYLYVIDRVKDVMKYHGYKYSPHQIESIVAEIPDVVDVCVFGVYDVSNGHLPAAAVVKKPGSTLTESDVVKYVESRTEVFFKRLAYGAFFVNELPRNRNGKLLRNEIMEMCLSMEAEAKEHIDR